MRSTSSRTVCKHVQLCGAYPTLAIATPAAALLPLPLPLPGGLYAATAHAYLLRPPARSWLQLPKPKLPACGPATPEPHTQPGAPTWQGPFQASHPRARLLTRSPEIPATQRRPSPRPSHPLPFAAASQPTRPCRQPLTARPQPNGLATAAKPLSAAAEPLAAAAKPLTAAAEPLSAAAEPLTAAAEPGAAVTSSSYLLRRKREPLCLWAPLCLWRPQGRLGMCQVLMYCCESWALADSYTLLFAPR